MQDLPAAALQEGISDIRKPVPRTCLQFKVLAQGQSKQLKSATLCLCLQIGAEDDPFYTRKAPCALREADWSGIGEIQGWVCLFFSDRKHSLGEEAKLSGSRSWACRELQSGFLPDSTSLRESGAQRPSEKEKHPSSVPYFFSLREPCSIPLLFLCHTLKAD